jgi:hypothetical protein
VISGWYYSVLSSVYYFVQGPELVIRDTEHRTSLEVTLEGGVTVKLLHFVSCPRVECQNGIPQTKVIMDIEMSQITVN